MELNQLLVANEIMWRQRSRLNWLKYGDKNTSFFRPKASQRKRKNTVHRIKDHDGRWREHVDEIHEVMQHYFSDIFRAVHLTNVTDICGLLKRKLSPEQSINFNAPFSHEDVDAVV